MNRQLTLTVGPSREQLFDCLRLGAINKELRILEFWGDIKNPSGSSSTLLLIEIEGLHKAGKDNREWFFWGHRRQSNSGKLRWEGEQISFVFGRWNTYQKRGFIQFGETSFFVDPFGGKSLNDLISPPPPPTK